MVTQISQVLEVAKDVLKSSGLKGMHVDMISTEALKLNKTMGLSSPDFSRKLQAALASNVKSKSPSFVKINGTKPGSFKKGWYRVKVDRTVAVAQQIEPPETDKAFIGKAGEMSVMSELLFWGYNASAMLVDSGIDLVASKGDKYFHVQVKTSTERDGSFQFSIKNSSFENHHSSSMFYVFVLRRKLTSEFVIIPSSYIQALVAAGKITKGTTMSVSISVDAKGRRYLLNNSTDVGIYVGNFGGLIV